VSPLRYYLNSYRGLPKEVWALSFVCLVHRAGTMVLPFLTLWMTQDLGFSAVQVGTVMAAYGIGAIFGAWSGGQLTDRLGAIRTMHLSLWGAAIGFLLLRSFPGPILLPWVAGIAAAAGEGFRPAVMTALMNRAPEAVRARSTALLRLAVNVGMTAGPAVAGFLVLIDYDLLFIVDALTCIAASFVLARTVPRIGFPASEDDPKKRSMFSLLRDPAMRTLFGFSFVVACVIFQLFGVLPLWLKEVAGFREDGIGLLLGFNALLIVFFEMPLVHWLDRFKRKAIVTTIGGIAICLGFASTGLSTAVPWLVLSVILWTMGEMIALPLSTVLVAKLSSDRDRGHAMGLYMMTWSIAFVVAPAGGIALYRTFGEFWLWTALASMALPLLILGRRLQRSPAIM
jgi:MFS family permease